MHKKETLNHFLQENSCPRGSFKNKYSNIIPHNFIQMIALKKNPQSFPPSEPLCTWKLHNQYSKMIPHNLPNYNENASSKMTPLIL